MATRRAISYPTMEEVENGSNYDIVRWNRFLASPENDNQVAIISAICDKLCRMDPAEKTKASKSVGW